MFTVSFARLFAPFKQIKSVTFILDYRVIEIKRTTLVAKTSGHLRGHLRVSELLLMASPPGESTLRAEWKDRSDYANRIRWRGKERREKKKKLVHKKKRRKIFIQSEPRKGNNMEQSQKIPNLFRRYDLRFVTQRPSWRYRERCVAISNDSFEWN